MTLDIINSPGRVRRKITAIWLLLSCHWCAAHARRVKTVMVIIIIIKLFLSRSWWSHVLKENSWCSLSCAAICANDRRVGWVHGPAPHISQRFAYKRAAILDWLYYYIYAPIVYVNGELVNSSKAATGSTPGTMGVDQSAVSCGVFSFFSRRRKTKQKSRPLVKARCCRAPPESTAASMPRDVP